MHINVPLIFYKLFLISSIYLKYPKATINYEIQLKHDWNPQVADYIYRNVFSK